MILEILQNGQIVETHELNEGSYKIGRSSTSDIRLASPQVSKQHALLVVKGGKAAIVDAGSSNGVFVNGVLIKKQRINFGDEITVANFTLRLVMQARSAGGSRQQVAFDGNAAMNLDQQPVVEAPPSKTPQEKFLQLVDDKLLAPFYEVMKSVDWRFLLGSILLISLVLSVFLSVIPIVRWGRRVTSNEALARAHTVLAQTVRENYRLLSKSTDHSILTVEACEAEKGMLSCYIVDPMTTSIMAPVKLLNKSVNDEYSLYALERIKDKEETVSVQADGGTWVVAQPIYVYNSDQGDRGIQAVALANFQIDSSATSTFEPMVEAALFAILMSLAAYFFVFKMISRPILRMQEQLDTALKGEAVSINPEVKFAELENLAQVINFSVSKMQAGAGAEAINPNDPEVEDGMYEKSVEEFDAGSSDAILLLDMDKKVRFVGKALEDLVSMRNMTARGQNISDACRDGSFAGTAIDMTERVASSLGETQVSQLEINGTNRTMVAVGHKNGIGELRFVLVIVKLGA